VRAPAQITTSSPPSVRPGPAPTTPPPVARARQNWSGRDAARVSIVKSTTEPGLFYVRLLADGKEAQEGFEGLLVALDPDALLYP
jgi:hypothetical protein